MFAKSAVHKIHSTGLPSNHRYHIPCSLAHKNKTHVHVTAYTLSTQSLSYTKSTQPCIPSGYCLLNLPIAWNLITFNSEVTDVLAWPPNDFYVMKIVCTENLQWRKITLVWNDFSKATDSAFTVNVCCLSRLWHEPSVALQTHQLPAPAYRSQVNKETSWRHVDLLLRLQVHAMLFWLLLVKLLSALLF